MDHPHRRSVVLHVVQLVDLSDCPERHTPSPARHAVANQPVRLRRPA
jgi:hypothetical protein